MTKEKKMAKLYETFLTSGLDRKIFCEQEGINIHTFKYWQRKLSGKSSGFLRIKKEEPVSLEISLIEFEFPNGIKLRTTSEIEIIRQLFYLQ